MWRRPAWTAAQFVAHAHRRPTHMNINNSGRGVHLQGFARAAHHDEYALLAIQERLARLSSYGATTVCEEPLAEERHAKKRFGPKDVHVHLGEELPETRSVGAEI